MKNDGLFAYHLQRPNWIIEEEEAARMPMELAFVFAVPLLLHTSFSCHLHKHIREPGLSRRATKREPHKRLVGRGSCAGCIWDRRAASASSG